MFDVPWLNNYETGINSQSVVGLKIDCRRDFSLYDFAQREMKNIFSFISLQQKVGRDA